jgi:hypothetical protein
MSEESEQPAASSPDEAQARLHEGLDNVRRLVKQARFMLGGENDESPA